MAEQIVVLAVHLLESLHTSEKLSLLDATPNEGDFRRLCRVDVERIIGRRLKIREFSAVRLLEAASSDLKYLTQAQIAYTFYWNSDYPPLLRETYEPPFVLYYRGHLPEPSLPLMAIVGTRRPTGVALRTTFELAAEFGISGIAVVSGLARGVDSAAHRGNIHGGGKTVAVLGSGIDTIYPSSNRRLAEAVLDSGGMICSEFAPGVPPLKYHFPGRNRIISGLSRGVVVTEAPAGSGALITADFCLEQGRDLYVHEQGLSGVNAEGCRALAENGAPVISSARQVLADWYGGIECGKSDAQTRRNGGRHDRSELDFGTLNESEDTGKALADLMRQELSGTITRQYGAYFRSSDLWQIRRSTPC